MGFGGYLDCFDLLVAALWCLYIWLLGCFFVLWIVCWFVTCWGCVGSVLSEARQFGVSLCLVGYFLLLIMFGVCWLFGCG